MPVERHRTPDAAGAARAPRRAADRWGGLASLVRARLLVATLALPVGVLLRPEASETSWWVLWWSLLAVLSRRP